MQLIKKITPTGGIAKTPLEILKRAREVIAEDGNWTQGAIVCFTNPLDLADLGAIQAAREKAVEDLLRNGLCGSGWGMCAMGALSYEAGLHAVTVEKLYNWEANEYRYRRYVTALVDERGEIVLEALADKIPAVRVDRYMTAGEALDAAAEELFDKPSIVQVNDEEHWVGDDVDPSKALKNVLRCFDHAIAKMEAAQ